MSDIKATVGSTAPDAADKAGWIAIELDERLYPKDAIYGAAYVFIDRCYVHLDRPADHCVKVTLRAKRGAPAITEALAGEFENELLGQAWRLSIAEQNRQLIETVTARALGGAAGPPGLDELLAMDIGDETAFDDPLGIAMSWEEKYAKKKGGAQPNGAGVQESVGAGEADGGDAPAKAAGPQEADEAT